jgi:fructokinase
MSGGLKIAGLGEVLWDVFPEVEKFGGAPANFACHCRRWGAEAYVVSCVGDDRRGQLARDFLLSHGVDVTALAVDSDHETGVVRVTVDENGRPEYEIKEDVAWDNIPWNDALARIAPQLDAVCFGSACQRSEVCRETVRRFVLATSPPCLRVFDVNLRWPFYDDQVIRESLEWANVLKLNDEELPVVAAAFDLAGSDEQILQKLVQRCDLKLTALTRGPQGAAMITRTETSVLSAPDVEVVDTVGAGDCFTAAMIIGFLEGKPLREINRKANQLAAFVCTQTGALPALPRETR